VLDIGCGIGGSALFMARHFGAHVHGVDLSTNMLALAHEYRNAAEAGVKHRVQFHMEDATTMAYPRNFYDVVYSRDTILHIQVGSYLKLIPLVFCLNLSGECLNVFI
jgi:cyclopropane fatty-acyl-phospholipid synthase-like methyltransferase